MKASVLLIADDLTGAAESAAAFLPRDVRIHMHEQLRESRDSVEGGDVVVVDTDCRYAPPDEAQRRCRSALSPARDIATVMTKVDSTLRGPLAAQLTALLDRIHPVIMASSLPVQGRTVVGGRVLVDGVPLAQSGTWAAESGPAPTTVGEVLLPVPSDTIGLDSVRSTPSTLVERLGRAFDGGAVAVCDAETDDDLDRIVRAGRLWSAPVRWAGSAGLAYALARADGRARMEPAGWDVPGSPAGPPLFVVGSASAAARHQVSRLAAHLDEVVELDGASLLTTGREQSAAYVAERTAGRSAVVYLADNGAQPVCRAPEVARALARTVAPAAEEHGALFLSGGETARAVLHAIGVAQLRVRAEWGRGVVASTAPDGRVFVTKPGGFGGPDTLLRVAQRLGITISGEENS